MKMKLITKKKSFLRFDYRQKKSNRAMLGVHKNVYSHSSSGWEKERKLVKTLDGQYKNKLGKIEDFWSFLTRLALLLQKCSLLYW